MTLPRLKEMAEYWQSNPPLHLMVAAYFGVSNPKKASTDGIADLLANIEAAPHQGPPIQ